MAIKAIAVPPVNHSQRLVSSWLASRVRSSASTWLWTGATTAKFCVNRSANASSTASTARGRVRAGRRGERRLRRFARTAGDLQVTGPHRRHQGLQVRLARLAGVEWLKTPGRAEQQPGRLGAALLVKGDLPA
jgi:hypothetical protein